MKKISWVCAIFLGACTHFPSPSERNALASNLAESKDWIAVNLPTEKFKLVAYLPASPKPAADLTIYIEGDGFAWVAPDQPSDNPTPLNPLALRLALAHPEGNAAYLARPCQFISLDTSDCSSDYWTNKRFSPEVIDSMNRAISDLITRFKASAITLIGYSGGGAVATLAAAKRNDIERLVTVAGNLDHKAWSRFHKITPLYGSLNPIDFTKSILRIPQWHLVGGKDHNITPEFVKGFADSFPNSNRPNVLVENEFDHQCCWAEVWPTFWLKVAVP